MRPLAAVDETGVRDVDDALVMGDAIADPETGDIEYLHRHGCDVIALLMAEVRKLRKEQQE